MSKINVDGININYKLEGKGTPLVLLHGWGQNLEMMDYIFNYFKENFLVLSLDFPGFGKSDDPSHAFSVGDYCENLKSLLDAFKIENPILVGHSFGCRVAIKFAAKYPVRKMVLTGAAGLKPKRSFSYYIRVYSYKVIKNTLKLLGLKKLLESFNLGSGDYKNAKGVMKETFVKVVNDDLRPLLKDISCPVLLVWGEKDEAVDLSYGRIMEQEIRDAGLVIFENDDHFAYFNQPERFNRVIEALIEKDKE